MSAALRRQVQLPCSKMKMFVNRRVSSVFQILRASSLLARGLTTSLPMTMPMLPAMLIPSIVLANRSLAILP
ncbi:MAG: hypothetical protein R3E69_03630 [Steroidobacteraceae bacterium]